MGYKTCYRCNGYGYIQCFHTDGYNPFCIRCDGRGKYECSICKGTGKIYVADSASQKKGGGIGGLVVIGIIIAALFGGKDKKTSEKIYQLYFDNNCNRPIQFAINYEKPSVGWITEGWWRFSSNDHGYLMSSNKYLLLKNHIIYFYAETLDRNFVWDGDKSIKFKNLILPMRQAKLKLLDKDNNLFFTITCN